tara:strand:+ start:190 stop:819 length:630 start_codon:yes stop_codon:yes gene_type:complete
MLTSRSLTGWILTLGPIVTFTGFLGIVFTVLGGSTPDGSTESIKLMGENADLIEIGTLIGTFGLCLHAAGIALLNAQMKDGSGSQIMLVGTIIYVMGTAGFIIESALLSNAAEWGASGELLDGIMFFNLAQAVGSWATFFTLIGFSIVGLAILIQKNFNMILAYAFIVIGLAGAIIAIVDYSSDLMIIGYLGNAILLVIAGILTIRSNE